MPRSVVHTHVSDLPHPAARILDVEEASPADEAGLVPGCLIEAVDGKPLRDILDWQWYSDDYVITLSYIDLDGDCGEVELVRDAGEGWGITFDGAVFDGIRTCKNACVFCFMRQLPENSRDTLMLRDDDWRLSFLQGNFVTLTNLSDEDADTIIERNISPLRVSLHSVTPEVRQKMIGKHAPRGLEMAEKLMAGGVKLHCQIVLVPEMNDAAELAHTLAWAYLREGIENVGIVPLGFTRHQTHFEKSYDDPADAQAIIELVEPFQRHAVVHRGYPWVYLADEFYCNAYPQDVLAHIPSAEHYGDFPLFEDGIGIVRTQIDEWQESLEAQRSLATVLDRENVRVHYVLGEAQRGVMDALVDASPLAGRLVPLFVENEYFGGNVGVTGLLCGRDVARTLCEVPPRDFVALPRIMFNADGLTLDDMTVDDIRDTAGMPVAVVSCSALEYLAELEELVAG